MSNQPLRMVTWPGHASRHNAITGGIQRDHATCVWNGRPFAVEAFRATAALCAQLVAAGCPDRNWEAFTPAGTRSLSGPSIHRHAKRPL